MCFDENKQMWVCCASPEMSGSVERVAMLSDDLGWNESVWTLAGARVRPRGRGAAVALATASETITCSFVVVGRRAVAFKGRCEKSGVEQM